MNHAAQWRNGCALLSGGKGCRFESCLGRFSFCFLDQFFFSLCISSPPLQITCSGLLLFSPLSLRPMYDLGLAIRRPKVLSLQGGLVWTACVIVSSHVSAPHKRKNRLADSSSRVLSRVAGELGHMAVGGDAGSPGPRVAEPPHWNRIPSWAFFSSPSPRDPPARVHITPHIGVHQRMLDWEMAHRVVRRRCDESGIGRLGSHDTNRRVILSRGAISGELGPMKA